jgi:hypothetical protein
MPTIRLMPEGHGKITTAVVNGRSYSCALGATIDVVDFDAYQLMSSAGWIQVAPVGTTAQRPAKPGVGNFFHDTTVGKIIIFEGAAWRDPATGTAV